MLNQLALCQYVFQANSRATQQFSYTWTFCAMQAAVYAHDPDVKPLEIDDFDSLSFDVVREACNHTLKTEAWVAQVALPFLHESLSLVLHTAHACFLLNPQRIGQ